jgi:hypothetical protein
MAMMATRRRAGNQRKETLLAGAGAACEVAMFQMPVIGATAVVSAKGDKPYIAKMVRSTA